jgi:hypothetical protein
MVYFSKITHTRDRVNSINIRLTCCDKSTRGYAIEHRITCFLSATSSASHQHRFQAYAYACNEKQNSKGYACNEDKIQKKPRPRSQLPSRARWAQKPRVRCPAHLILRHWDQKLSDVHLWRGPSVGAQPQRRRWAQGSLIGDRLPWRPPCSGDCWGGLARSQSAGGCHRKPARYRRFSP